MDCGDLVLTSVANEFIQATVIEEDGTAKIDASSVKSGGDFTIDFTFKLSSYPETKSKFSLLVKVLEIDLS